MMKKSQCLEECRACQLSAEFECVRPAYLLTASFSIESSSMMKLICVCKCVHCVWGVVGREERSREGGVRQT
jgi:hypothetical protein